MVTFVLVTWTTQMEASFGGNKTAVIALLSFNVSPQALVQIQCNQAREQNFFISEFEPILAHKIRSIIDKNLKFGTNLLQHKLYIEFKLWDIIMITSIFMAS